jgi:hypothetical protein
MGRTRKTTNRCVLYFPARRPAVEST